MTSSAPSAAPAIDSPPSTVPPVSRRPVVAILAGMPFARLMPERFGNLPGHACAWIYALFHSLASQQEFDIHWLSLCRAVTTPQTLRLHNQTVHLIPQKSLGKNILCGHIFAARDIRRTLKQIRPDLLHIWGTEQSYAMAARRFAGKKLLSLQGALTAYCQRAPQKFLLRMQAFWERRAIKHYPVITGESPWSCARIAELNPAADISLMEYGVEPGFYSLQRTPSPEPSALFAGTVYELKGARYLVQAFSHPSLSHVQLYIAGSGALMAQLQTQSAPNIHWLGNLTREQLQLRMQQAWFLVHPTLADCSPNIVKEARVMGLPVITTPAGGQTQYVQDGVSGYIVPVKDSTAIRQAALKLAQNVQTCLEMGAADQERCRLVLRPELTAQACITRYRRMLGLE